MLKSIVFLSLILLSTQLYTSSYWAKKGFNVKDGKLQEKPDVNINIDTVCNDVKLTTAPYDYKGIVKSGYLRVGKGNSVLGFTFYGKQSASQAQLPKIPVILWLNGGPGSSSQLGNFMELGPFWLTVAPLKPIQIKRNPYAWTQQYSVLFVDQPIGTGLSYAETKEHYCKSMDDVANDFYFALNELYQTPKGCFNILGIKPDNPLVIYGESYGGKYAPAIGKKIAEQKQKKTGFLTGLRGVAIGDGFTDPYHILTQVGQYAYNLGLLDYQERTRVEQLLINATYQRKQFNYIGLHDSFDTILDYIVRSAGGVNVYDITKYRDYPDQIIGQYLNSEAGRSLYKLNAGISFGSQSDNVYQALYEDFMMHYTHLVEDLLRYQVDVLVYSGQNDLIVPTPGTFKWVHNIFYENSTQFRQQLFQPHKVGNKTSGYHKHAGKLALRTFNNAGHLVPMDQGQFALDMIKHFVGRITN